MTYLEITALARKQTPREAVRNLLLIAATICIDAQNNDPALHALFNTRLQDGLYSAWTEAARLLDQEKVE